MASKYTKNNIREIAAAANVSVATVSRTLQRPELVREKTRNKVQEVIKRFGYTPNAQARNLRTAKTRLVVALVPDIANPFFSEVIRGIEQVAHEHRYSVLLGDTQNSPAREQAYADMLVAKQADGLITLMPRIPKVDVAGRLPIVNACECVKDPEITTVALNNQLAASAAVNHLITLGHQRIAFIGGPSSSPITRERHKGYDVALKKAGLSIDSDLVTSGDFSVESGVRAVEQLLARKTAFTAIFCANDEMSIGAINSLRNHGLRVPEDVSIVGFDDIRFSRYMDPPLTTIAQPKIELGREAATLLLEILNDISSPVQKRILTGDLIVRKSTAPCSTAKR